MIGSGVRAGDFKKNEEKDIWGNIKDNMEDNWVFGGLRKIRILWTV